MTTTRSIQDVPDAAVYKMAELSRLADDWMDADNRVRTYLEFCALRDLTLDAEHVRELHLNAEAAKARYFEAVQG